MPLAWTLSFATLAGLGSVALAALVLLIPERPRARLLPLLISFAAGTLLGGAFVELVPEAFEQMGSLRRASITVLAGMLAFFFLERSILGWHCHDRACDRHKAMGPLILLGDGFHNFADGVTIAAAFLTSKPAGVAVALAVLAHEVPQEIGNFAILLESGYGRRRALLYNVISNAAAFPGALVGVLFLEHARGLVPYVLAVSAASFIYIAAADLLPELHRGRAGRWQAAALLAGAASMLALGFSGAA